MTHKIIITSTDSGHKAEDITEKLLKEKLAACVNIVPVSSHFWWKKKIQREEEFQMIIKTKAELVDEVIDKINKMHSYELPLIEVIDVEKTSDNAEKWINEVTK